MKTAVWVMVTTVLTAGALSSGQGADPSRELCFELVDGSVITGRLDAKAITFQVPGGSVLTIPVADLIELSVGLNDLPEFVQRVEALVKALDSAKTRQDASRKLLALGWAIIPIIEQHAAGDASPRRAAVTQVMKVLRGGSVDCVDWPRAMWWQLQPQSRIVAGGSRVLGTVTVKQFRIASRQGPVIVKLGDVHQIHPSRGTTPSKVGRWAVELRDRTHIRGTVISESLRVQTCYGPMVIPFARIQKAVFAADGKGLWVQSWGLDRFVGTLGTSATIQFKTDKGRVDLSAGKIAVMTHGALTIRAHSGRVTSVAFSPDGKRLASANWGDVVKLWDTADGKELFALNGNSGWVYSVAFSPDGKCLASGSYAIKIWDPAGGKELLTLSRPDERHSGEGVTSLAFSPDGKRLASGSNDRNIKLWDTATGKDLLTLKGHLDRVISVAFSPDGKRLASGSADKTIKVWDTAGGEEPLTLKGHVHPVACVAFSPDGKRLASGGNADGTIKLWDSVTGKELPPLKGHSFFVHSVAFSPDGKRLASGSGDKTVRLWDTAGRKELLTLKGHLREVKSVAFSPDGKHLASGSQDHTIKLWEIPDWTK